jgi:tetratricopeptide (TPR) repeat protein
MWGRAVSWAGIIKRAVGLGLSLSVCGACWPAFGQGASPSQAANPEYHALFRRMFADPKNMDVTFKFADVAVKSGDYEAAIGALERVLFFNPNLPRVRLQLGVLYFKLGSYRMARSYLEQAQGVPGAPSDVQSEAAQFIAEIDRRLNPQKWSVFAHTGLRYQSNANAGPTGLIRSLGQDALINDQFAKQSDWNWFALFGASYTYDIEGTGVSMEAGLIGYYSKQFKLSQFDLGLIELQVGPRFALPSIPGGSIKPYAIAAAASLDSTLYFMAPGAGVLMRFSLGDFAKVEPFVEIRDRTFRDSMAFPTSSQQSGTLTTVGVVAEGAVAGPARWFGRATFDRNDVDAGAFNFNGYKRWSVDVGLPVEFSLPWGNDKWQVVVTPIAGYSRANYDGVNLTVDPNMVREDWEWRVGMLFDVQLYERYGLRTQVQYARNHSNLSNYDFSNFSVTFGPTARF